MELSVGIENAVTHPPLNNGRVVHSAKNVRANSRRSQPLSIAGVTWSTLSVLLIGLLYFGWIYRNERHWVPETGIGYWLGILGGVAMLALLIYPLRKRFRSLRFLGSVPAWFRIHMALGLVGPSLILLHCNFGSKSLNATVALSTMLIVAGSGLIGRFLYGHVHSTLSGRRLAAMNFFEDMRTGSHSEDGRRLFGLSALAIERVSDVTKQSLASPKGLAAAIGHAWLVRWQTRQLARVVSREIRLRNKKLIKAGHVSRRQISQARRNFEHDTAMHLAAVRKASSLTMYERFFSLWHFLHLPLFMMLVMAAIVHIIAVHLY